MKKITTVLILLSIFLTGCFNNKLNVILKEPIIIEYGSNEKDVQFFDSKKSDKNVMVKEIKGLDSKKIGEQVIHVTFADGKKEIEKEIKVQVKDTKIPVIDLLMEKLTITVGDKLDLSKAVKNVSDQVDGNLKYSEKMIESGGYYFVTDKVNTKKAGNYKAQIIAVDKNGNKSTAEVDVTVKKKVEKTNVSDNIVSVDEGNKPSIQNNNETSQTTTPQYNEPIVDRPSNQSSTKPSSKPSQPTKPHVHHFDNSGYTNGQFVGPVFDNDEDCMRFADNYVNPDWAGYGYTTCLCSCGKWRAFFFDITYPE